MSENLSDFARSIFVKYDKQICFQRFQLFGKLFDFISLLFYVNFSH